MFKYIPPFAAPRAPAIKAALVFLFSLAVVSVTGGETPGIRRTRAAENMKQALRHLEKGEYALAIPILRNVLAIDPSNKTAAGYLLTAEQQMVEPYCNQALDAYLSSDYETAIGYWRNVLKLNPNDRRVEGLIEMAKSMAREDASGAMIASAENFFNERQYESAVRELEKILLINPNHAKAGQMLASIKAMMVDGLMKEHYEKADSHLKRQEYDLAIEQWRRVLAIDGRQEAASRNIAMVQRLKLDAMYAEARKLYESGAYLASRDLYLQIAKDNPTDLEVKKILSRLNEVLDVVMAIEGKGPSSDYLRKALANHISPEGNPRAAIAASWYAGQLDPSNRVAPAVRDFLERTNIAVLRTMETPQEGMNIIDQYLFAVLTHIYENRYDLAIEKCLIVLELQPENVLALKRLGSAYFSMGKKEKARGAWERALGLSPEDKDLEKYIRETK